MKKFSLEGIDTIIFDLGMVIINLEMEATTNAFKDLFRGNYQAVIDQLNAIEHFEKYETGKISSHDFIQGIAKLAQEDISDLIPNAWNAMLKDIPDSRFSILNQAKKKYKTYCLSNTNEMHIEWIYEYLQKEKKIKNLDSFFDQVYLSHEIGMRKPDAEIFDYVIKLNSLDPKRTLFIDDTLGHLEGAKKCGLNTFHLSDDVNLEGLFKDQF